MFLAWVPQRDAGHVLLRAAALLRTLRRMCAATLLPWLNFIVLFLTLVCVALYLSETRAIRIANEAQLEAQIRPALTVGSKGAGLGMFNVGNGAALNLQIVRTKGEEIDWAAKTNFGMRLAVLR